jgi:hypothetical protein
MVNLRETASPFGMNDFGPTAQTREHDLVIVGDAFTGDRREALAIPIRRGRATSGTDGVPVHPSAGVDAEQAGAAPSPFLQIPKIACVTQPAAMGRDHNAVTYREVADFQGLKESPKAPRRWLRSHAPLLPRPLEAAHHLICVPSRKVNEVVDAESGVRQRRVIQHVAVRSGTEGNPGDP